MVSRRSGNGWHPVGVRMCPRNRTRSLKKLHFSRLICRLFLLMMARTFNKCFPCVSVSDEAIMMSSRYANAYFVSLSMESMKRCRVCAALRSPKGMNRYSKFPNGVVTAVFCMSDSFTGNW